MNYGFTRPGRVRALGAAVTLTATALLLVGCATVAPKVGSAAAKHTATAAATAAATATASAADAAAASPPFSDLVGTWRLAEYNEPAGEAWIVLGGRGYSIYKKCGSLEGGWLADDTRFIASIASGAGHCRFDTRNPSWRWLTEAAGYVRSGADGYQILGANGEKLATLTPTDGDVVPHLRGGQPGGSVADLQALMSPPAELPARAKPTVPAGRWIPVQREGDTDTFLDFLPDRSWKGSDGCNGASGRWLDGDDGVMSATIGGMTQMGCKGSQAPHWMLDVRRVGMIGDELTLFDGDGNTLGSLVRDA